MKHVGEGGIVSDTSQGGGVNFIENAMFLCHKGKAVQFDICIVGIYRDLKHFVLHDI
jgi:hypothetical protein